LLPHTQKAGYTGSPLSAQSRTGIFAGAFSEADIPLI
jgi:hypothetical protein